MYTKVTQKELAEVLDYYRQDRKNCLYSYIDLKKYGEDTMLFEGGTEYLEEEDLEKALSQSMEAVEGGSGQGIIEKLLLVEYAVGMFQSLEDQVHREDGKTAQNLRGKNYGEGIFRNETEYLIQGSANEYDNLRSVEMQILGIRMIMNIAYLASSSEKQSVFKAQPLESAG